MPASAEPTDSKSPLPAKSTPTPSTRQSKVQPQPFTKYGAYDRGSAGEGSGSAALGSAAGSVISTRGCHETSARYSVARGLHDPRDRLQLPRRARADLAAGGAGHRVQGDA